MGAMLEHGVDVADKKTQIVSLQAELSRVDQALETAYANLGRSVYALYGSDSSLAAEHAVQVKAIEEQLSRERELKQQIKELERQAAAPYSSTGVPSFACPRCGNYVLLSDVYCSTCGDNLADLKTQYCVCSKCNKYYVAGTTFCEVCGRRTLVIPIAQPLQNTQPAEPSVDETINLPASNQDDVVEEPVGMPASDQDVVEEPVSSPAFDQEVVVEEPVGFPASDQYVVFEEPVTPSENPLESVPDYFVSEGTDEFFLRCPVCGQIDDVGGSFCGNCGTRLR